LLEKLRPGFSKLNCNADTGRCTFKIIKSCDDRYKGLFEDGEWPKDGETLVLNTTISIYLFGDFKFLYAMLGRSGYESSWCLYCTMSKAQWKEKHQSTCNCDAGLWDIKKLSSVVLENIQRESNTTTAPESSGVKEQPLVNFIPMHNVVIPLLHELLGLGNDVMNMFRDWIDERMEPLTIEEMEARNMAIMAEISFEEANNKVTIKENELLGLVNLRKELIVAEKQGGLSRDQKVAIRLEKNKIRDNEQKVNVFINV
jgi:hypothetical protein